jgi:DNA polymerase I-like protein with 3'-5' exonuclease and polymerase domains
MQIHDELVFEFPKDQAEALAEKARALMILGMQDVLGGHANVQVDIAIGETW